MSKMSCFALEKCYKDNLYNLSLYFCVNVLSEFFGKFSIYSYFVTFVIPFSNFLYFVKWCVGVWLLLFTNFVNTNYPRRITFFAKIYAAQEIMELKQIWLIIAIECKLLIDLLLNKIQKKKHRIVLNRFEQSIFCFLFCICWKFLFRICVLIKSNSKRYKWVCLKCFMDMHFVIIFIKQYFPYIKPWNRVDNFFINII